MPVLLLRLLLLLLIRYENLSIDQPFFEPFTILPAHVYMYICLYVEHVVQFAFHFEMRANKDNIMQPHGCLKNLQENLFEEVDNSTFVVKLHGLS